MTKGVFLDKATMGEGLDWQAFKSLPVDWTFYETTAPEECLNRIQDCTIVVTNKVKFTPLIFAHPNAKNLKLIALTATGMDNIDLDVAKDKGVLVKNVKGYATGTVVQHTIGLMIQLASGLHQYQNKVAEGLWHKSPIFCMIDIPTIELDGKSLGIIGYGQLGQGVAKVASALGMNVLIAESFQDKTLPNRAPLSQVLQSDVVSLHCPLTAETEHLINDKTLSYMHPNSFLINTARGGLIDEKALIKALKMKQIKGAALDTLSIEPPTKDNPLFPLPPNLLITPHSAWGALEARQRLLDGVVMNVKHFLSQGAL